jgi:hypothetical protein
MATFEERVDAVLKAGIQAEDQDDPEAPSRAEAFVKAYDALRALEPPPAGMVAPAQITFGGLATSVGPDTPAEVKEAIEVLRKYSCEQQIPSG